MGLKLDWEFEILGILDQKHRQGEAFFSGILVQNTNEERPFL